MMLTLMIYSIFVMIIIAQITNEAVSEEFDALGHDVDQGKFQFGRKHWRSSSVCYLVMMYSSALEVAMILLNIPEIFKVIF